jgi:hypothetical protein
MNGYKQGVNESKLGKGNEVDSSAAYDLDEAGRAEQGSVTAKAVKSGSEERLSSALNDPEDWERGYD